MSVDFPSSTDPAVANRSISVTSHLRKQAGGRRRAQRRGGERPGGGRGGQRLRRSPPQRRRAAPPTRSREALQSEPKASTESSEELAEGERRGNHQKYPSRLRSSMPASDMRSSARVAPRSV